MSTKEKKAEEVVLQGQATQEQIKQWKQKYGRVAQYIVDGKVCYLRYPDRLMHAAAAKSGDPMRGNEIYLANMFIGGCEDIKTVDKYYLGICRQLATMIEIVDGELGEL